MPRREVVRTLRHDGYVLTTKGFEGYYNMETPTMLLIGGSETGTHMHVDISEGCNIAFQHLNVSPNTCAVAQATHCTFFLVDIFVKNGNHVIHFFGHQL